MVLSSLRQKQEVTSIYFCSVLSFILLCIIPNVIIFLSSLLISAPLCILVLDPAIAKGQANSSFKIVPSIPSRDYCHIGTVIFAIYDDCKSIFALASNEH